MLSLISCNKNERFIYYTYIVTTNMSKQVMVKTIGTEKKTIKTLFRELVPYLKYFGFKEMPMMAYDQKEGVYQSFVFECNDEKILMEYFTSSKEEVLKLSFFPMNVSVIYDVVVMRINQIANLQREQVFIHKTE